MLELLLAFVLSTAIGVERELRQKSAGLRTHTLVGIGTAVFVEASKYGFADVLPPGHPGYDPSRIAAQIVSGIGFIGGGLIFVRRDAVRGLTTAASVWLTCAVAMASAAGLPWLALSATAMHFIVAYGYTPLLRFFGGPPPRTVEVHLTYLAARGVLPTVLVTCTGAGFQVSDVSVHRIGTDEEPPGKSEQHALLAAEAWAGGPAAGRVPEIRTTSVMLGLEGSGDPYALIARLTELRGVLTVAGGDGGQLPE
ncbi:MgtC/SapB family protein [Yinghuangia soli]|uniref:MgtC/SapB family protein n=1 Tax=Yinghuangia soli TaxID=2908204 RepID=A0AA41TZW2_9ACTN|nr:MgtC/SapB family protein [Yinghuangia soli]MCF2527730.1 MgtC/SapB family protein [Yinghuangia soli]